MLKLKNNRGSVRKGIRLSPSSGWTSKTLGKEVLETANQYNIPVKVFADTVSTGGLFAKEYPCVVVTHPNPPQKYFDQVIVFVENTLYFYFFGYSTANYNVNQKQGRQESSSLWDNIVGGLQRDDSLSLSVEQEWHSDLCGIYDKIFFDD